MRRLGLRGLAFLRARIRASELWLAVIAAGVGAVAGLSTVVAAGLAWRAWENALGPEVSAGSTSASPARQSVYQEASFGGSRVCQPQM